jgi:hypothetical protein
MNSSSPSDKPLGPELELGPELNAMELREYQIFSTEAQDAVIEFETGETEVGKTEWISGPRGLFRFQIPITDLGVLGRLCLQAVREFSAENYAHAAAKLEKTPRGDL